jgi:hypothetical protein
MKQQAGDKIAAIQLLRAFAAITVAAGHIAFAFADHIGPGLGLAAIWRGDIPGQLAVMLCFILSGHVIVLAAAGQFGQPGARWLFWRRRFIRIMPPYWLATLLLAAIFLTLFPTPIDGGKFGKSLALIPYWPDTGYLRPMPFLWVGWTLFYEMTFYCVFGLFLAWPRQQALLGVAALLAGLVIAGTWVPPVNPLLFALPRPVSVMFAAGMAIALWRTGGARRRHGCAGWRWRRAQRHCGWCLSAAGERDGVGLSCMVRRARAADRFCRAGRGTDTARRAPDQPRRRHQLCRLSVARADRVVLAVGVAARSGFRSRTVGILRQRDAGDSGARLAVPCPGRAADDAGLEPAAGRAT